MLVYAIIPARSGSKGLDNKNILIFNNHPLIAWSICAALQSKLVNRVFLSTNSRKYAEIGKYYGAEAPFLRPAEISNSSAQDISYIYHFLGYLKDNAIKYPDYLVLLRPTSPLRDPLVIDHALETIMDNNKSTGLRSLHISKDIPEKMVEIDEHGFFTPKFGDKHLIGVPRQECPKSYMFNCYVDIMKLDDFFKDGNVKSTGEMFGASPIGYITNYVTDINSQDDFVVAERHLNLLKIKITKDACQENT